MKSNWNNASDALFSELVDWEEEFYVGISAAAKMSGLSESQIRYLESLPGVKVGRQRGRNREYTKRDIKLLRWIYRQNLKPADIIDILTSHQEEILQTADTLTLQQVIQQEELFAGHSVLVSSLVQLLLSIWLDEDQTEANKWPLRGVILGPQSSEWQDSVLEDLSSHRPINLSGCLIISLRTAEQTEHLSRKYLDPFIFFSKRTWFLPYSEAYIYDTTQFFLKRTSFSIAFLWQAESSLGKEFLTAPGEAPICLDQEKRNLTYMLLESLSRVLDLYPDMPGEQLTIYSRLNNVSATVNHDLELFLRTCVHPFFPHCSAQIVKWKEENEIEILSQIGDPRQSATLRALAKRDIPWWFQFVRRKKTGPALAQDVKQSPWNKRERGSVVCVPLLGTGEAELLGAISVELVDREYGHCLSEHEGYSGTDLLQYLLCVAEIAGTLLQLAALPEGIAKRVYEAHSSTAMLEWYEKIYLHGALNYSKAVNEIVQWLNEIEIEPTVWLYISLIDIANDTELVENPEAGFAALVHVLQETKVRIEDLIMRDHSINQYLSKRLLFYVEEPVTDHLVFAAVNVPESYLQIVLDRIRTLWKSERNKFRWRNQEYLIWLNVGYFRLDNITALDSNVIAEMLKHYSLGLAEELIKQGINGAGELHVYTPEIPVNRIEGYS